MIYPNNKITNDGSEHAELVYPNNKITSGAPYGNKDGKISLKPAENIYGAIVVKDCIYGNKTIVADSWVISVNGSLASKMTFYNISRAINFRLNSTPPNVVFGTPRNITSQQQQQQHHQPHQPHQLHQAHEPHQQNQQSHQLHQQPHQLHQQPHPAHEHKQPDQAHKYSLW